MKRILMVDDVATNLRCAAEILKEKYEITAVKSGEKAMAVLQDVAPDLVLLDVYMPGMDGFEVFEQIRMIPEFADVPVIFMTAESDKNIEARARTMGAADFIRKPYEPDILMDKVEKAFSKSPVKTAEGKPKKENVSPFSGQNAEKLKKWADSEDTEGYFILFDLENFEKVKEVFGVSAEEEILRKIAGVLSGIPEISKCFCQVRNSVFAMYLDEGAGKDLVKSIVRRVIAELEFEINESIPDEFELKITISAGIAAKPEDGRSYRELWEHADKALYFAGESGKRRYHFYGMKHGEGREGTEDKETISLLQLKRQFEGSSREKADGRESLQKACRVISRYWEDNGEDTQVIFFDINGTEVKETMTDLLARVIASSLRKGDVSVKCGKSQYIAVLKNTSAQNGEMVAGRIRMKFEEKADDAKIKLVFEMRSI